MPSLLTLRDGVGEADFVELEVLVLEMVEVDFEDGNENEEDKEDEIDDEDDEIDNEEDGIDDEDDVTDDEAMMM